MSGKYTWKLIVALGVLAMAITNLIPLFDTKFEDYVREHATAGAEWNDVMAKVTARQTAATAAGTRVPTLFVALRDTANAENLDLGKFFPDIELEPALNNNLRKKNAIVLDVILRRARGQLRFGLDLSGGVAFTLEIDADALASQIAAGTSTKENQLADAIKIIGDRVDALGVAEPVIRPVGENRIVVQLAGESTADNPDIENVLKKPALLEFRQVHPVLRPGPGVTEDMVGAEYEEMVYEGESGGQPYVEHLYVLKRADVFGRMVTRAMPYPDPTTGNLSVQLEFDSEGRELFGNLTSRVYQEAGGPQRGRIAIILDGIVQSAPTVIEPITGGIVSITGKFTDREAIELTNVLNNPLDVPLRIVETSEIGPTLAEDAVSSGLKAFIIGTAITVAFIAIYYTTAGLLAVVAMALNIVIILGVMCSQAVGATLTMPGIAGIVLTIAMSVDANILIFERMREEMAVGKNLRASLEAGFEKAFSAILDGNVTTLITAAIMMWLGTGPVKGFGVTLTIGIFSTMFAALIISRLLLEVLVYAGGVQKIKFLSLIPQTKFDFLKWARPAFIVSWLVVLTGFGVVVFKGEAIYGIDFRGGDEVTITFDRKLELGQIDAAARSLGLRDSEFSRNYQTPLGGGRETLKIVTPFEQGDALVAELQKMYPEAGIKSAGAVGIGPSVSGEIKWNAVLAIALSLVGILLYVAFRFEFGYGVGAVISTVHDVFMTIGMFVLLGGQFNAAMIGAILLIVGYSINDTIVVFDRIREELHLNPNARLRDVINLSLNKTLARTIITGGTTFCTAITLAVITTDVVHDISVTLIIGIITGTFSSLFIASPIFFWWHKGDRKHVEESHDITPKYEWSASSKATE